MGGACAWGTLENGGTEPALIPEPLNDGNMTKRERRKEGKREGEEGRKKRQREEEGIKGKMAFFW